MKGNKITLKRYNIVAEQEVFSIQKIKYVIISYDVSAHLFFLNLMCEVTLKYEPV